MELVAELMAACVEFVARDSSTGGEIRLRRSGRPTRVEDAGKSPENLDGGEVQI